MPKTQTREWTETGADGKPVTMVEVLGAAPPVPTNTSEEIAQAIAIHRLQLVTAIRDAKATWGEGRILSLIQTIEALEKWERNQ
jgi:hypothetical protein